MLVEDNILVLETLNGNTKSFGMLVEKYQNKMFNLALQITSDSDCSQDIVQDAFIKAFNKLRSFNADKKFFSWIYRITLNESLNFIKHSKFSNTLKDEDMTGENISTGLIERNETSSIVRQAISRLDDKYKTLIVLKHYQELSYDEISHIMNIPVKKVKSRLYIAREQLRLSLEGLDK